MDIKQKFKDLLNLSKEDDDLPPSNRSLVDNLGLSEVDLQEFNRDASKAPREVLNDPLIQQEILETVEAAFVDDSCDGGLYQLQKLTQVLDLNVIRGQRQILGSQLSAVTNKLFSVILQKQTVCGDELLEVLDLQLNLDLALETCENGRSQIKQAKNHLTTASLRLLSHQRRRQHLVEILKSLKAIYTLGKMRKRVEELLGEESYAGAIQLLMEGQHVAETYKQFNCVAQLSCGLQDTLEMAEEQLDVGLANSCHNFNPDLFNKLQLAFKLLGKESAVLDQLNLHLASRMHQQTFNLVKEYVEKSCGESANQLSSTKYSKLQFQELCSFVNSKFYVICLQELCTCLWKITLTCYNIHEWYKRQESDSSMEQKLLYGSMRLWQDVQNKMKAFLQSANLCHFSSEEFLRVLDIVNRFVEVGKQFCGSHSEVLRKVVRQQCITYFRTYHLGKLDELRLYLENECWERCPVRSDFTVHQLVEFQFIGYTKADSISDKNFFELFSESLFPEPSAHLVKEENFFVKHFTTNKSEEYDNNEDECSGPLLANTTLSVLRLFGRYIHFMHLLDAIAFDVLICLNQLFDYYLYSVYNFFGTPTDAAYDATPPKLRTILTRIEDTLLVRDANSTAVADGNTISPLGDRIACPQSSLLLQMENPNQPYALKMRLIAAESVVFLARQLQLLHPKLVALIPEEKQPLLHQFVNQTLSLAQDLRTPIYANVACKCIDAENTVSLMSRVQWEVKEVMTQHNAYVDRLLQSLGEFNLKIESACRDITVPPEVYNILWDQVLRLCYRALLDGFSSARKCTNEGRALMQLDLRQFQMKVEGLTRLRPLPDASLVEAFIKAFYLPETALDQWIQEHTEYSSKQLMSLLQCAGHSTRKNRLNLTAFMEELDLSRR